MEKCKTLGEQSFFYFSIDENERKVLIKTSNVNAQISSIDFGHIVNQVWNRIGSAQNEQVKYQTSYYNQPMWNECPNNILCPYIAKLLLDVCSRTLIENMINENE